MKSNEVLLRAAARKKQRRGRFVRALSPWLFLSPALLVLIYFKFIPMIKGIQFSFYKVGFLGNDAWVGLANFSKAVSSLLLRNAFLHTVSYVIITVFVTAMLGFLLALVLEGQTRQMQFLRAAVFLPVVTSIAVVAEVWRTLYYPTEMGIINRLLEVFGFGPFGFFSDPAMALGSIMAMSIWRAIPYDMVIFAAGLAMVDRNLYSAASIDGANLLQRVRFITIPSIRSSFTIIFTLGIIRGFRVFAEVYITTGGGPARASEVMMTHIYKAGFVNFDYGYASAVSSLFFVMTAVLTTIYLIWERRSTA